MSIGYAATQIEIHEDRLSDAIARAFPSATVQPAEAVSDDARRSILMARPLG